MWWMMCFIFVAISEFMWLSLGCNWSECNIGHVKNIERNWFRVDYGTFAACITK